MQYSSPSTSRHTIYQKEKRDIESPKLSISPKCRSRLTKGRPEYQKSDTAHGTHKHRNHILKSIPEMPEEVDTKTNVAELAKFLYERLYPGNKCLDLSSIKMNGREKIEEKILKDLNPAVARRQYWTNANKMMALPIQTIGTTDPNFEGVSNLNTKSESCLPILKKSGGSSPKKHSLNDEGIIY